MAAYRTGTEAERRYQNAVNNAQGHFFEGFIKAACVIYSVMERAEITAHSRILKGRFRAGGPSCLKQSTRQRTG